MRTLSSLSLSRVLRNLKVKVLSTIRLNNHGGFEDANHVRTVFKDLYRAVQEAARFLNIKDVSLPVDTEYRILTSKIALLKVLQVLLDHVKSSLFDFFNQEHIESMIACILLELSIM